MAPKRCAIQGCTNPVAVRKHGLCWGHVKRYYRTGVPGPVAIRKSRKVPAFKGGGR